MKINFLSKLIVIAVSIVVISCGDDDKPSNENGNKSREALKIASVESRTVTKEEAISAFDSVDANSFLVTLEPGDTVTIYEVKWNNVGDTNEIYYNIKLNEEGTRAFEIETTNYFLLESQLQDGDDQKVTVLVAEWGEEDSIEPLEPFDSDQFSFKR